MEFSLYAAASVGRFARQPVLPDPVCASPVPLHRAVGKRSKFHSRASRMCKGKAEALTRRVVATRKRIKDGMVDRGRINECLWLVRGEVIVKE